MPASLTTILTPEETITLQDLRVALREAIRRWRVFELRGLWDARYNGAGEIRQSINAAGQTLQFGANGVVNLQTGKGIQILQGAEGSWLSAVLPNGVALNYSYDKSGKLVSFQQGTVTSRYAYDGDRLTAIVEGDRTGVVIDGNITKAIAADLGGIGNFTGNAAAVDFAAGAEQNYTFTVRSGELSGGRVLIGVRLSAGTQAVDGLTAISNKDGLTIYEINSAATYRLRLNGAGSQTYQVTLVGDVNRDGRVDVVDSEAYQNKDLLADVDGNGAIDRSDAELIASNYGFVAQPGFGTGAGNIETKNVAISEIVTLVTGVPFVPVTPPSALVGSWLFDLAGALPVGMGSLSDVGWQTQGDVVLSGQRATLGEGNLRVARLGKAFTIPLGAQTLKFTLQTNWGKAVAGVPGEAVQVSLRGADGVSLLGNALDGSSGFLNVQADGRVHFTNAVKGLGDLVTGDTLAGDSHTFLVDVRSIAQNSPVIFSLDFLGNGAGDGQVIVSDVGIVVVEAPVAVADRYNSFQGVPLTINPLANDKSSLGTIIDPTTLKITNLPQFGQVIVNNDGTLTYTPSLGFIGVDLLTYTVADNYGVTSNIGVTTLKVTRPRVLIQETIVPTSIVAGAIGNFAIEASSQTNTDIIYRWDFGDGTKAIGQNINHSFANTGTYNVSLTAIDQQNIKAVQNYTVIATNEAPKVLGIEAPAVTVAGQSNVFKSINQDADALTYRWSFGDGSQPVYEALQELQLMLE